MSENSLKNMAPRIQPGQVLNTTGKNGTDRERIITDEYERIAKSPLPEKLRLSINRTLGEEYLKPGVTFKESLAVRMHLEGVLRGVVHAATEIREAIEGRSTMRVEFTGRKDRLEGLVNALANARNNPPAVPSPDSALATDPAPKPEG